KTMRLITLIVIATAIWLSSQSAQAQAVTSQKTASNGIVVDVNSDSFANRYEYSAPVIHFKVGDYAIPSFVLVAKIKSAGVTSALLLEGTITYGGEWHFYTTAL